MEPPALFLVFSNCPCDIFVMVNLHTYIFEVEIFHEDFTYEVLRKKGIKGLAALTCPGFSLLWVKKIDQNLNTKQLPVIFHSKPNKLGGVMHDN